ncbi:response regulator transcription factor [Sphingobacterium sp. SYP-B4668]|uniref:response regulator transcription factor n=1 Tax=Sphingobacterium sp. SYP-B4668 TaxID=2996035 RepID=UPI0005327640|nr:response regulator transcription factor [Sphingobacterium sp. SYP-B4668]
MKKIKIMLAEDHLVVRNGIKLLLDSQDNFEVVGEVGSGKEILDLLSAGVETDILITDLGMHNVDGIQLIKEVKARNLAIKVIVLTMLDCEQHVAKSFECGAKAYLVKNVAAEELIFCVNHVAKGGRFLCEELMIKFIDKLIEKNATQINKIDPAELDLSSRELEVLELLGEGLTNLEISKRLFLSKRTVEGHRQSLIDKTKSKNTPALIKFALQNGLIH